MSDLIQKALTAKRESKYVEFKQSFDPTSSREWCEVIKDIVALANSGGGIIVFGLNNNGTPSGISVHAIAKLDPADIANKITRYTGAVDLEVDIRELRKQKHKLVAFVIQASPIPLVFEKPGTYDIGEGKQRTAFSMGTVYFRHVAKSEPGTSEDFRIAIERQLEAIRKSWVKGVRKVVQAPPGSQIMTVQPVIKHASSILSTTVRPVKDPNATPVFLTRDPTKATGSFIHEEMSDGIFDEINNVIDANRVLAKGQQRFFLGQPVYYRIYAERHHVTQSVDDIGLLLHSAVTDFYAPFVFWALKLPPKIVAQTFTQLYLQPKNPNIHCLMRIAVLLGEEFCRWLYDKWHNKWNRRTQPPSYYWSFKDIMTKMDRTDPRIIAARISPTLQGSMHKEIPENMSDFIEKPERAAAALSRVCMRIFKGETNLRTAARSLDYLAYGSDLLKKSTKIAQTIIKSIGNQVAGDVVESI
jgi:hypothetical protein